MRTYYNPKNNPRVIIIQKLYGKFYNDDDLDFPKHRFKKFIKDISKKNDSKTRIGGTIASSIFLMMQGIQILRIHDVNEVMQGIKVFRKLIEN